MMKPIDEASVMKELPSVITNPERLEVTMAVMEAYILVQSCQLLVTHPDLSDGLKDRVTIVGRRIQERLRPFYSDLFADFVEAGWHREFDR